MNCRETRPLLPLFFDGELEAHQMRQVALHSTRCPGCEGELRQLERLQDAIAAHLTARVEAMDLSELWTNVAPRLEGRGTSLVRRLREWWEEREFGWPVGWPAVAGLAALAVLAVMLWRGGAAEPAVEVASQVDNSAVLDSVHSSAESVALVTDADTNTTLLWVMDDGGAGVDEVADQWDAFR